MPPTGSIKKVLFVCSGNTCRSPMAAAIFDNKLRKDAVLCSANIEVRSAGTSPSIEGMPATPEARKVIREWGLDIDSHRAGAVDQGLIRWADAILVMGEQHKARLLHDFPDASDKVHLLTEFVGEMGEVRDPIGGGMQSYRLCANQLDTLLNSLVAKMAKRNMCPGGAEPI